jgi:uncharacterized Zn-finger protein
MTSPETSIETLEIDTPKIACDGGKGASGHPRVFLTVGKDGKVDCPYCGKRFILQAGASIAAH